MPHPTAGSSLLSFVLALGAGLTAPACMVEDDGLGDDQGEAADRAEAGDDELAVEPADDAPPTERRADAPNPTTGDLRRGHSPYSPDVVTPDDPQSGDGDAPDPDPEPTGPGLPHLPGALAAR